MAVNGAIIVTLPEFESYEVGGDSSGSCGTKLIFDVEYQHYGIIKFQY